MEQIIELIGIIYFHGNGGQVQYDCYHYQDHSNDSRYKDGKILKHVLNKKVKIVVWTKD